RQCSSSAHSPPQGGGGGGSVTTSVSAACASCSFTSPDSDSLASGACAGAVASRSLGSAPASSDDGVSSSSPVESGVVGVTLVLGSTESPGGGLTGPSMVIVGATPITPASPPVALPSAHEAPVKPKSTIPKCAAFTSATLDPTQRCRVQSHLAKRQKTCL